MTEIKNYSQKLEEVANRNKTVIGTIAKFFILNLDGGGKIENANEVAKQVGVSNAMISKFAKEMGYENIYELLFVHRIYKRNYINQNKISNNEMINKNAIMAAKIINSSRKIFMVGVSNGYSINYDFSRKLNRLDMWTYVSDNKYEQIGVSRLLTKSDVMVVTSVSLNHSWMKELIKKTPAKVILLSNSLSKELKNNVDLWFKIFSPLLDTAHRVISNTSRINALRVLDEIFIELIKNNSNELLLKATRYNKK